MAFGSSFGAFVQGFDASRQGKKAEAERTASNAMNDRLLSVMEKQADQAANTQQILGAIKDLGAIRGQDGGGGSFSAGPRSTGGGLWGLLSSHEGAGDFDTLYGHSQREGGRFAGIRPSQMTLGELYKFTDPSGEYGQWVASQNKGVVATPIGAGQIVGSTLQRTAKAMGLPDDTRFSPEVQKSMIENLAWNRIKQSSDPARRRMGIRNEWVGLRNAADADVDAAINEIVAKRQPAMGAIRS